LQTLGNISGTTLSGDLLVKVSNLPSIHQKVYDFRKNEVGRVVNIFGNVQSPYVLIRPRNRKDLLLLIGKEVFIR